MEAATLTLVQAVRLVRKPLLEDTSPTVELLRAFVTMVKLNDLEWSKVPSNDVDTQKWAEHLMKLAKRQGWFSQCVQTGLLPEAYRRWPNHVTTYPPKLKPAKFPRKSVMTITGGAFEQNRRKH
jgi:hypothetical protein